LRLDRSDQEKKKKIADRRDSYEKDPGKLLSDSDRRISMAPRA